MITYRDTKALGFQEHHKGTRLLREAANLVISRPEWEYQLSKDLIPVVARKHGSTYARAERAIRYAIRSTGSTETVGETICTLVQMDKERRRELYGDED